MDEKRIAALYDRLGLDEAKRAEFAHLAQQGPLSLEPEQPADFRLDCSTLTEGDADEEGLAELV
jgi:hypothetical protein